MSERDLTQEEAFEVVNLVDAIEKIVDRAAALRKKLPPTAARILFAVEHELRRAELDADAARHELITNKHLRATTTGPQPVTPPPFEARIRIPENRPFDMRRRGLVLSTGLWTEQRPLSNEEVADLDGLYDDFSPLNYYLLGEHVYPTLEEIPIGARAAYLRNCEWVLVEKVRMS